MDPLISLTICNPKPFHSPGETLLCECQIDAIGEDMIRAVESSILWRTEGKGDEDLTVHFFERRTPADAENDLRELHRFETVLPKSPLSYEGRTIKIRWCVRVRLFQKNGKESFFEVPFQLGIGHAPRKQFWSDDSQNEAEAEDDVPLLSETPGQLENETSDN